MQKNNVHDLLEIIDSSSEGSFLCDMEKGEIYYSSEWSKRLGIENLSPREATLVSTTHVHPEDREHIQRVFLQACEQKAAKVKMEFRVKTVDSGYIWILGQGKIIYNQDGRPVKYYGTHSDITEQKKAEAALKESERKYHDLFNSIDEGYCVIEVLFDDHGNPVDYRFLEVNQAFERQTGLTQAAGRCMREMAPDHEQEWFDIYGNIAVAGESLRFQQHADALGFYYDVYAFRIGEPEQRRVAILFKDITDRKQAEDARELYAKLAEEKAVWLQNIIDLMPAGIWISDHTGKVVTVNQAAVDLYGGRSPLAGSPEEYTSYQLFLPGTDEPVVFEPYVPKEALTGVVLDFERFDGTRGTQVASTQALRDQHGTIINYVAIAMDITPLRQAEMALQESEKNALDLVEELRQSKEELKAALQSAEQKTAELNATIKAVPDGLTVYNLKGEMVFANDVVKHGLESYAGSVQGDLKQRMEVMRSTYLDGTAIKFEDTGLYRALSKGETVKDSVAVTRLNSGKILYTSSSCAPIKDTAGEITGAVMIQNDITKRIQLEKQTEDLVKKLLEADQNKNAFINILSHELRNPLASIMMSLDLLDQAPAGGKQATRALEVAKRQGKQLSFLVDDLLEVTRISRNKITLKKEAVELNELIHKAAQDYQPQFLEKNVGLEVKLTSPIYIKADPYRLTQAIGNLLHNAAKFTSENDQVIVTVSEDSNSRKAVITSQDTGHGIDPEYLGNILDPFIQADQSLDRSLGGLGLGLSIVKGIVELHGGTVEAFSEGKGKGSRFTIRLPLPEKYIGIQEHNGRLDPRSNQSLNILMIEDNKDLADIMCELIEYIDHKAVAVHDGTTGLAKAKELRPDVIICDIGLPDMSGYKVAKLIRKDSELQDTYLIALSGYAQPEDLERSKEAGFDRHLSKPVSLETLQKTLMEKK